MCPHPESGPSESGQKLEGKLNGELTQRLKCYSIGLRCRVIDLQNCCHYNEALEENATRKGKCGE